MIARTPPPPYYAVIFTSLRTDDDDADPIRTGTVTFFNDSKGYGFIKDSQTQESIFVHANGLAGGPIGENDKVAFEVEMGPKGPNAVRVKPASATPPPVAPPAVTPA